MHRQLHWLDVVDRVNYKIGLLVYKCLHGLAPGYLSDQCVPASTFAGRADMRSSSRLDRLLYVTRTKIKTLGPRGFLLRLVCHVELAPGGLAWSRTLAPLKSHFFIVDWFCFFVSHSCTLLLSIAFFFAVRANVIRCSLAGAYKCLNWIELKYFITERGAKPSGNISHTSTGVFPHILWKIVKSCVVRDRQTIYLCAIQCVASIRRFLVLKNHCDKF